MKTPCINCFGVPGLPRVRCGLCRATGVTAPWGRRRVIVITRRRPVWVLHERDEHPDARSVRISRWGEIRVRGARRGDTAFAWTKGAAVALRRVVYDRKEALVKP